MHDDGYIARTCAVLDPKMMGYPITIIAQVEVISVTRTLFFGNDNVKRFKTLVAMHRGKTSLEIPTS